MSLENIQKTQSEQSQEQSFSIDDQKSEHNNEKFETKVSSVENLQNDYFVKEEKYLPTGEEKEFYDEILDKLDIKKKDISQTSQEEIIKQKQEQNSYFDENHKNQEIQIKEKIENILKQDFVKIQKLVQNGLINSGQGQNLKKQVLKKAFDKLVQTEKIKRNLFQELNSDKKINVPDKALTLEEFSKNNPDFFTHDGRREVLDYLKSDGSAFGKDDLNKISEIIRIVEKSAIDRYLQKTAYEKSLQNYNESAKRKLTANAQKSSFSGNLSKTFTREQIGKMSGSEFAKYEKAIMEQLKKGQIK